MKKLRSRTKRTTTKSVLRLPDVEYAKAAVLQHFGLVVVSLRVQQTAADFHPDL
jgi:hypothetical protein